MTVKSEFFKARKNRSIRHSWGIGPFPWLIIIGACLISLVLLAFPQFPLTGIRLAVFVIASSILLAYYTVAAEHASGFIARWWAARQTAADPSTLSPLAHRFTLSNVRRNGYIYLVRRFSDGVYKIGKTRYFDKRFKQLCLQYGPLYTVAVWEVPNFEIAERVALKATRQFWFTENGHKELRGMSDADILNFIRKFSKYVESLDIEPEQDRGKDGAISQT